jgi:hypothetical protein
LPKIVRALVPLRNSNTEEIRFSNGSEVSIGTTFRGETPQILHVSEYGKTSMESPDRAREIRTGGFNAVAKTGKIFVESTAHGTGGEFHEIVQCAQFVEKAGLERSTLDFKLHFFPWWMDEGLDQELLGD